jgi:hypothetical protein
VRLWPGPLLLVLSSAGCSAQSQPAHSSDLIDCALAGAGEFRRSCKVEKAASDGGAELVVRHPDGGFRRFEVVPAGLATADGVAVARNTALASGIEVAVGPDRYRFPTAMFTDVRR